MLSQGGELYRFVAALVIIPEPGELKVDFFGGFFVFIFPNAQINKMLVIITHVPVETKNPITFLN